MMMIFDSNDNMMIWNPDRRCVGKTGNHCEINTYSSQIRCCFCQEHNYTCGRFTSRFQESMTSELRLGNKQLSQGHKFKISLCNNNKTKNQKRFIIQYMHIFITRFLLNIFQYIIIPIVFLCTGYHNDLNSH